MASPTEQIRCRKEDKPKLDRDAQRFQVPLSDLVGICHLGFNTLTPEQQWDALRRYREAHARGRRAKQPA